VLTRTPKRTIVAATLAIFLSAIQNLKAGAQETTNTYNSTYQFIVPFSKEWAFVGLGSFADTPDSQKTTIAGRPVGFDYQWDQNWSIQSYFYLKDDIYEAAPDKLELRPVVGLTYKLPLPDEFEFGAWLRYEARFLDGTGIDTFQNRLRLRTYLDYKLNETPDKTGSWHVRLDFEPKYGFDTNYGFVNAMTLRPIIGVWVSPTLLVDFRYSRDWTRATAQAPWLPTNNTFSLYLTQTFGDGGPGSASPPQIQRQN
jgi:hypothetical protein